MRRIANIIIVLLAVISYGQETISIASTILDSKTGEPVEFVNIGIQDRGIGTVSNAEGNFNLTFNTGILSRNSALKISSIGYETKWNSYNEKIFLIPSETVLGEVVLFSKKREYERLGSESYSLSELGYWRDKDALGGELATRIHINKEKTRLIDFKFNILENASDSLLVRINIYDCHGNMPGNTVLKENIYHIIRKKKGIDTVALKKYNIKVNDDIVVAIELVKVYGEDLFLSVSATPFGGTAYLRERSQDHWDVRWGFGLGFGLLSSYPASANKNDISVNQ